MKKLVSLLDEISIPYAYHHFAQGKSPKPPFICYLFPRSENFSADGRVYLPKNMVSLELYSDKKSVQFERKIEAVLDRWGIFYNKSELYIDSEKLYEVLYQFSMEVEYEE